MSRLLDLSCDLGEARSDEERAVESAIWPMISAANVACGGHVGDEESMREAIERCVTHGVSLGAHPSYPDREGFGRRHVDMTTEALVASLSSQIELLRGVALERGIEVERVKPHGALYNEAQKDAALALAIIEAVRRAQPRAAIVCAAGSQVEREALRAGIAVVREAFVDRRYASDGALQPRGEPGSLLLDPEDAAGQAVRLAATGAVVASDGTEVPISFETLCAHSDMPGSAARIQCVLRALGDAGFAVQRRGATSP